MNLSEWGSYSANKKTDKLEEICEQVTNGEMPDRKYMLLHRRARPDAQRNATSYASGPTTHANTSRQTRILPRFPRSRRYPNFVADRESFVPVFILLQSSSCILQLTDRPTFYVTY